MNIKRIFTTAIITGVLVIGAVTVSAQDGGRGNRGNRDFGAGELVETYTGLSGQDLREAFANGSTLAELIEANGQSVDAYIAEARASIEERLNEAVANGNIDAEAVAERLAQFDENISERLNTVPELRDGPGRDNRGPFGDGELVETYTGLSAEELREAFVNGSTLGELIEANGQSTDAFIAEARVELEAHLDETATERLVNFDENIEERLNTVPELGNGEGRRGNRGPRNDG